MEQVASLVVAVDTAVDTAVVVNIVLVEIVDSFAVGTVLVVVDTALTEIVG